MTSSQKLAELRVLMQSRGLEAYVVNSADAHQSEYVTEYWRTRAWLSGFTGSNGLVVVTANAAGLWTDGRYFIQAERQISDSGIQLFKMEESGVPTYREWLAAQLPENGTLGFDGRTFSVTEFDKVKDALKKKNITFACEGDLIGEIWKDRPPLPSEAAFEHELCFAGRTRADKLAEVREEMRKKDADLYLLASLDEIAWLLNIRGRDIPQTPVVFAYVLITAAEAHVFIDPVKMNPELAGRLAQDGFTLHAYDTVHSFIHALEPNQCLWYDADRVNIRLAEAVPSAMRVIRDASAVAAMKAVKNETELMNIRQAHIKEGVVMVRLLKWLEEWVGQETREALEEADIHDLLTRFREEQMHYLEPSFDTIAAYRENAASMHYSPVKGASKAVEPEGFLLVDTGGQYLDGTTDITRTIVMGNITDEMKRDFTLVLKGHVALASAQFLSGITGTNLDILARLPLWAAGQNYRSGTGHGLGYCLGVHEGPHNISMRANSVKLAAGMLCTNEPGVYKEGRYGIRTENVLLVKELFTNDDGTFMGFDILSFCPIDRKAIAVEQLTATEMQFVNDYHQKVFEALSPYLNENEQVWLRNATNPL